MHNSNFCRLKSNAGWINNFRERIFSHAEKTAQTKERREKKVPSLAGRMDQNNATLYES